MHGIKLSKNEINIFEYKQQQQHQYMQLYFSNLLLFAQVFSSQF